MRLFSIFALVFMLSGSSITTQVYAMEYGDKVQTTGLFITSWLSNKFHLLHDASLEPQMATTHYGFLATLPALAISKKCGLVIAGAALTYWAAQKMYSWAQPATERGE